MSPPDAVQRASVATLIATATAMFATALATPMLHITFEPQMPPWVPDLMGAHDKLRDWLVDSAGLPVGDHYILGTLRTLFADGEWLLGLALALFSLCFPVCKIAALALLAFTDPSTPRHRQILRGVEALGKWSMADVFVVAVLVVTLKAEALHFHYVPGIGLYAYAGAALTAGAASWLMVQDHRSALAAARAAQSDKLFAAARVLRDAPGAEVVRSVAVALRDEEAP